MAKKQTKRVIELSTPTRPDAKPVEVEIPDDAVSYIVGKYVAQKARGGEPLVIGISTEDVETVLGLFIEWSAMKGYIKDGVLSIGGDPIG